MTISKAAKVAQRILDATSDRDTMAIKALSTLIELGKKVSTRQPPSKQQGSGMPVCVLVRSLLKAKNQRAMVQITDTEGSFTDDQIITVDESEGGEDVNIVLQYVKL